MENIQNYINKMIDKYERDLFHPNKTEDWHVFYQIFKRMMIFEADEVERSMLQFGMFYDGLDLHVDSKIVNEFNEDFLQTVLFNHITNHLIGACFKSTVNTSQFCKSYFGLIMSHLGLNNVVPQYSQSIRSKLYEKFYTKIYPHAFGPHKDTFAYVISGFLRDEMDDAFLQLAVSDRIVLSAGTKIQYKYEFAHLTLGSGLKIFRLSGNQKCVGYGDVVIDNDNKIHSNHTKIAKDINNAIKIMKLLG